MKLYLYNKNTGQSEGEMECRGYTGQWALADLDKYIYHGDFIEYSAVQGEQQGLRAKYRQRNPSESDRIAQLEDLMTDMIFGGEGI